jgi:hypothetical protein
MYALQYSQITKPRSSNRPIYCGLVPKSCRSRVLDDWCSGNPLLDCIKKSRSRFVHFRKMSNASMKYIEHLSLKRPRKCWVRLWKKHISALPLSLARSLLPKCVPKLFLRATNRFLYRLFMEWWIRSQCPGSRKVCLNPSSWLQPKFYLQFSKKFRLPQFNMGADPIILSAIMWQGCHCSNQGGN